MSNYIWGTTQTYTDYLQQQALVDDNKRNNKMLVQSMTRELIGSEKAIQERNMQLIQGLSADYSSSLERMSKEYSKDLERISEEHRKALEQTCDLISYGFDSINCTLNHLGAEFHWGFSQLIMHAGNINNSLNMLLEAVITPVQRNSYNQFEIARDNYRKGLLAKALDRLDKAINGVPGVSDGYEEEWRFHNLVGLIKLGREGFDPAEVNLPEAETSFLTAARYAVVDYPLDAAMAYLCAARAAYLQGKFKESLDYLHHSLMLNPSLGEAIFLSAKIHSAMDDLDTAYNLLKEAIRIDAYYAMKAAGDADFTKHNSEFIQFINELTDAYYSPIEAELTQLKKEYSGILSNIESLTSDVVVHRTLMDYKEADEKFTLLKERLPKSKSVYARLGNLRSKYQGILSEIDTLTSSIVPNKTMDEYLGSSKKLDELVASLEKYSVNYQKIDSFINTTNELGLVCQYTTLVDKYNRMMKLDLVPLDYAGVLAEINELFQQKTINGIKLAINKYRELSRNIDAQKSIVINNLGIFYSTHKTEKADKRNESVTSGFAVTALTLGGIAFFGSLAFYLLVRIFAWFMNLFNDPSYDSYISFASGVLRFSLIVLAVSTVTIVIAWIIRGLGHQSLNQSMETKVRDLKSDTEEIESFIKKLQF